jgi:hypothetical protein
LVIFFLAFHGVTLPGVTLPGEQIDSDRRIPWTNPSRPHRVASSEKMDEDVAGKSDEAPRGRSVQVVGSLRRRVVGKVGAAAGTRCGRRRELAAGGGGGATSHIAGKVMLQF